MKKFITLISTFLLLCAANVAAQETLFTYSSDNSRIPAITKLKDGSLLAIADNRPGGGDIGSSSISLKGRIGTYSTESKTWSWGSSFTIAAGNSSATGFDYAHGDAAVVTDRENGYVLVMAASGKTSFQNSTRQNPIRVGRYYNLNGTGTYFSGSEVTNLIYNALGEDVIAAFFTSGRMTQSFKVKKGDQYRIYAAVAVRTSSNTETRVLYSDDFGESWALLGGGAALSGDHADEASIEEMPDGSLVISGNMALGGRRFNVFKYTDDTYASGSWSTQQELTNSTDNKFTTGQYTNGELVLVPAKNSSGKKTFVALLSLTTGTSGRNDVGIYYKELPSGTAFDEASDFTSGWTKYSVVSGESGYSTMTLDDNGNISLLYEKIGSGKYSWYDIAFQSLSLSTITNGAYSFDAVGMTQFELSSYLGTSLAADYKLPTSDKPTVGKVYTIRSVVGYWTGTYGNTWVPIGDAYLYAKDNGELGYMKLSDYSNSEDALDENKQKMYWVLNKGTEKVQSWATNDNGYKFWSAGDTRDYYYFVNAAGSGYMGATDIYAYPSGTTAYPYNKPTLTTTADHLFRILEFLPTKGNWLYTDGVNYENAGPNDTIGYTMKFVFSNALQSNGYPNGEVYGILCANELGENNYYTRQDPEYSIPKNSYLSSTLKDGSKVYFSTMFVFEEVGFEVPVTLTRSSDSWTLLTDENGKEIEDYRNYTTLWYPFDVTLYENGKNTDNLKVYKFDDDNAIPDQTAGSVVDITEITSKLPTLNGHTVLPARTPVLISIAGDKGDDEVTKTRKFTIAVNNNKTYNGETNLTPIEATHKLTAEEKALQDAHRLYVLGKRSGHVAIYYFKGDELTGFKAYYEVPATTAAKLNTAPLSFRIINEATDITNAPTADSKSEDIYTLQGVKVSDMSKKGIYIRDGKKFIVK